MTNLKKKIKKVLYNFKKKNKIKEKNKNELPTSQPLEQSVVHTTITYVNVDFIIKMSGNGGNFEIQNRSVNAECEMQKSVTHDKCDSGYSEGDEKQDKVMKYNGRCDSGYFDGDEKQDKVMKYNGRCDSGYFEGEEKLDKDMKYNGKCDSGYSNGDFENDNTVRSVRLFSKEKRANDKLKQLTRKHNNPEDPCQESITVNEDIQFEPEVSLSEEIEESKHQSSYQSNDEEEYLSISSASNEQVTHVKLNPAHFVLDTDSRLAFSTFDKDITDVRTGSKTSIGPGTEIHELVIQETECSLMEQKEPIADLPEPQAAPYNDETCVKHVTHDLLEAEPDPPYSEFDFSSGYPVFTNSNSSYSADIIEIDTTMDDTDLLNQNTIKEQEMEPLQKTPNVNIPKSVDLCVSIDAVQEIMTVFLCGIHYNAKTRENKMCQSLENDNRMAMPIQNCSSAQMSVSLLMCRRNFGYTIRISVLATLESSCRLLFRTCINMISLICSYPIEMICYMSDEDKCWSIIDPTLTMCSLNQWFGDMKALSKQMTVIDMLRQRFRQHTDCRQIVNCDRQMLKSYKEIEGQTDSMGEDVVHRPDSNKDMKDEKITDCFDNVGNNVVKGYYMMYIIFQYFKCSEMADRNFQVKKNFESKRNEEKYGKARDETSDNLREPFPLNLHVGTTSAESGGERTWTDEAAVVYSSNPDTEDNTDTVGIKITKPSDTQLAVNVSSARTCQCRAQAMYYLGSVTPEGSVSGHSKDQDLGSTLPDKTDGDDIRPEYTHESKRHEDSYERRENNSSEVFSDQSPSSSTTNVETSGYFIQEQNSDITDMSLAGIHESTRDTCCTPMLGHTEQLLRQTRCSGMQQKAVKSSQSRDSSMDRKSNSSSRRLKQNGKKRGSYFCKYCHKKRAEPNRKCKFPKMHIVAEANAETGHSASPSLDSGVVLTLLSSQLSSFYSSYKSTESQLKSDLVSKSNLSKKDNQRLALKEFCKIHMLRQLENELHRQVKTITRSIWHIRPTDSNQVFPGLAPYLEILNNGQEPSDAERYRHEWARFQSFERYRGNGSGIVLARNGFYHNSENGPASTRCFECGASYSNWEYFDNVRSQHHPNCPLNNGNSTRNNPIRDGNEAGSASVPVIPVTVVSSNSTSSGSLSHDVAGRETTTSSETGTGSGATSIVTSSTASSINTQQQEKYSYQPTTDRDNTEYTSNFVLPDDEDDHDEPQTTPAAGATGLSSSSLSLYTTPGNGVSRSSPGTQRKPVDRHHGDMSGNTPPDSASTQASAQALDLSMPGDPQQGQLSLPTPPSLSTPSSLVTTPPGQTTTPSSQVTTSTSQLSTPSDHSATSLLATSGQPISTSRPSAQSTEETESELPLETHGQVQIHPERILVATPKHPDHSTVQSRELTFKSPWPTHLDQTPRRMAEAGLFYSGVADFTRCYACGGGLRNWESGDDPVIEHTRWYPTCPYVHQLKGEQYVQAVTAKQQKHLEERRNQQVRMAERRAQQNRRQQPPDPLRTRTASILTEMGYSQEIIRAAIQEVRRSTGRNDVEAEQALLWIIDDEERRAGIDAQRAAGPSAFHAHASLSQPVAVSTSATSASTSHQRNSELGIQMVSSQPAGSQRPNSSASSSAATTGNLPGATGGDSGNESGSKGNDPQISKPKTGKKKKRKKRGERSATATQGVSDIDTESLKEENEKLREIQTCKICLDKPVDTTFLPCGHLVCCAKCASKMRKCPICRELIRGFVKTFMS